MGYDRKGSMKLAAFCQHKEQNAEYQRKSLGRTNLGASHKNQDGQENLGGAFLGETSLMSGGEGGGVRRRFTGRDIREKAGKLLLVRGRRDLREH